MSALERILVRMRPRSRMRISLCASRGSMLTISDLSLPGIGGSFGTARIGSSRRRCALGTLLARSAVTPQTQCHNKPKEASGIASAKTVYAVERLARSDRRLAATIDQWDTDPWQLNTPQGVIDLTNRAITTAYSPKTTLQKSLLLRQKATVRVSSPSLIALPAVTVNLSAYIQRVLGYGLTGLTREHALFFGYGTGANGKSVLLSTVAGILGDYHKTAPIETFTATNGDRHPTDLAGLRGARLVTATETEEGRRWAESRIKQLTGGDTVAARFMRQDFFEYRPAFKLIIAGNHKPSLRSVDEAIRRRFHLIPFAVTIPPEERDGELDRKAERRMAGHPRVDDRGLP